MSNKEQEDSQNTPRKMQVESIMEEQIRTQMGVVREHLKNAENVSARFRVIAEKDEYLLNDYLFSIREVFYDKTIDAKKPVDYSVVPVSIEGYSERHVTEVLREVQKALTLPILYGNEKFPKEYNEGTPLFI